MIEKKDVKPSNIKSADDLIIKDEAAKLGKIIPEKKNQQELQSEQEIPLPEEALESKSESEPVSENTEEKAEEKESQPDPEQQDEDNIGNTLAKSNDDEVDEYGTKIGKKKMYSEEEVQRMIRDRLKRGQNAEQQQDIQNAAKDFTPDPESNESWEVQLEAFVENTINKISKKAQDQEWRQRESQSQAEFEVKFSEGMAKYNDFSNVVSGKPITNAMMLATRSMKDPAAFLYAACKQQPKELARISQIQDPVTQAAEIGRLEERMKKARNLPSSPKPAKQISGDASNDMPQIGIDERIAAHAKSKIMR